MICFKLSQTRTDEEIIELMFFSYLRRGQKDINRYYKDEFITVSRICNQKFKTLYK
jgi:hypothetical protein